MKPTGWFGYGNFLFMPWEDEIIGLDLQQVEHPEKRPGVSSCCTQNEMLEPIPMAKRMLWNPVPAAASFSSDAVSPSPNYYIVVNRKTVGQGDWFCSSILHPGFTFPSFFLFCFHADCFSSFSLPQAIPDS